MSSSRSRPASQASMSNTSTRQQPLESLIYSALPSLAPVPISRVARSGRTSAASSRSNGRVDGEDEIGRDREKEKKERERRERVKELVEFCQDILDSRISSTTPLSPSALPDIARRMLLLSEASSTSAGKTDGRASSRQSMSRIKSEKESGNDRAMRFGGIWSKLERGKTLASPLPHLQFLMALSSLDEKTATTSSSSKSISNMMPPPVPTAVFSSTLPAAASASSSRRPLQETAQTNLPTGTDDWRGKGKSKADMLRAWRTAQSRPPFPDQLLLRDTLYLLQGIDGRYVRFAVRPPAEQNPYLTEKGKAGDGIGFGLGRDGAVPAHEGQEGDVVGIDIVADEAKDGYIATPTRSVLVQLSEMGMLYKRVTEFVQSGQAGTGKGGMTEQSLCHFLHHELSEYHRLLAVLESQLSLTASPGDGQSDPTAVADKPAEGAGLTLMRLGLWTEEIKMKMRMMDMVVDDAKATHGGALVSRIHSHTDHGDPFVRHFMNQVLGEVSKPFFGTLQKWIFAGELHDPFQEFFVQLNSDTSIQGGRASPDEAADIGFEGGMDAAGGVDEAHKVWEKKYVFVKGMVPGFVSEDFGKKIFSTGRSLNFIRYSCRDTDWIETQAKLANAGRALKYTDLGGLERSIDDAYSIASQRLLEVFFDKFVLLDHLRALKSYLMLGAGDFTELLMDALAPRLSKPAISLYRHQLTSDLETAIRGSNAQYDSPDILRRLDARVLEYSHGEVGWDCFALEYKVEAPLNAVLDTKAMVEYGRLFHHLWRLKRVETALTQGWMRVTSGSRLFERLPNLTNDWHHCRIVQAEMVHFLRQLQAFCQLEVIECSWQSLVDFTDKREGDLDALIAAHRTYLDRVVRKVLLLGSKRDKEEILLDLVRDALDFVLQFRDATNELYAWSLAEATRLDRERDEERGLYTTPTMDDPAKSLEQLRAVRERIRTCSINFQDRVVSICHLAGSHQDLDVRFLAIRIAFNGHYALRKSKTSKSNRG